MGITSSVEYKAKRQKDEGLPGEPPSFYPKEWKGWLSFLGKPEKNLYPTLLQASDAAQRLGIRTSIEYREKRKSDPRLPGFPEGHKDFPGWALFLGKV